MAEEVKKEQAPKAAAPKQNKAPKAAKPQQNAKAEKGAKGAAKKAAADQVKPKGWVPNLEKLYKDEIIAKLTKQFGYKTVMQVPKLQKITVNEGLGSATADKKIAENAQAELSMITGQKAILTYSKKDIATFKLRKGMPIGVKVTLRQAKMYEFMERLIKVSLPRIRDFKGIEEKFDGRGNYTLGLKEQIIFPEIDIDKVTKVVGMEITFVTSTNSDEEARALLASFGLPFKKKA
jgi:large subunit ribosomal protein L5